MSSKVIKCKKCGEIVAPNSKFCKSCGAKISSGNAKIIIVVFVVLMVSTFSFLLMYKSPHYRDAKKNIDYYNASVAEFKQLVEIGSYENPESWLHARQILDSVIRRMDNRYYDVFPDVYCQSEKLESQLSPKLISVAKIWSDKAERRICDNGDIRVSIKEFEYSLLLWDDSQVREELKNAHKLIIGQELNTLNKKLNYQMQK